MKRVAPPETHFLERDEIQALLRHLPSEGRLALRDRALLLFLYNTGARAQEASDLHVEHLDLGEHPIVRLHGKGDKWRTCPLWQQTARTLEALIASHDPPATPQSAVFTAHGRPLTRSGIYKIVRRHASKFDDPRTDRRVTPHTFRHTAAMHLLEAGVEVNVIREWLGHVDLTTTNRYAQINTKTKTAALRVTEPQDNSIGPRTLPSWRLGRVAPQLAHVALSVMCPKTPPPSRAPPSSPASAPPARPHNGSGNRTAATSSAGRSSTGRTGTWPRR